MSAVGRETWAALAVGLLAVLAGCSGPTGPGATESPTVTPAPIPASDSGFSPGVTAGGMNVSTVLSTHERALRKHSYTLTTDLTVRNRSTRAVLWRERSVARVAADATPFSLRVNYSEPRAFDGLVRSQLYYDGTTIRRAVYENESVRYDRFDRRTNVDPTNIGLLRRVFYQLDNVRIRGGPDGQTLVTGTLPYPRVLPNPPNAQATGGVTASASITPDGVVDQLAFGYNASSGGGPARVRLSTRVSDFGSTTVERPTWLGRTTTATG
jgi:hypothetical protein